MRFFQWQVVFVLLLSAVWAAGQAPQPHLQEPPVDTLDPAYHGITGKQRLQWFVKSTVGPQSLATGLFTAGIATAENLPEEYGPHWEGFGKRYGMRLTGVATGHAMEAGLGALWQEDPRYFRAEDHAFQGRMKHIVVMTFAARREHGHLAPAYARFISIPASNFLSNTWRADSVATTGDATRRTALGFVGRMGSNAFAEFWPDVKRHIFHKKK
jgi:hypothetical protein